MRQCTVPSVPASLLLYPGHKGTLTEDFSTPPLSIMSYSDDPDEQLETLNTLISGSPETRPLAEGSCQATTRLMDEGPTDSRRNGMLLDLPLTRPALTWLGMSFVRFTVVNIRQHK